MKKNSITLVILALLVPQLMLVACRKSESERAQSAPEAHRNEMVKKSLEESKKVIAAKVNGEPITMFALFREMNSIAPQYVAPGRQSTPELDAKVRNDALNGLILQTLGAQEARNRGLKVAPERIDGEMAKIKAGKGSENAFQKYLAENGFTEELLRKTIENDALFEMIAAQEVDAKITVTEAALRERYAREKAGLKDASHRQMTFESARGMLEQRIRTEAAENKMREWTKRLKENARIEIAEQKQKVN